MVGFSPCKINLGLNITEKRKDGFHNIETVFYPICWNDPIEVLLSSDNEHFKLTLSGLSIVGDPKSNLIYKAYENLLKWRELPHIQVILHKNIPMGAGLGGGSSDASTFINLVDKKLDLQLSLDEKLNILKPLGSDCAFFIENIPVFAKGKGDEFEPVQIDLSAYYILVIYPGIHSNTKEAYAGIKPQQPQRTVKEIIEHAPIEHWKEFLINDFEYSIFKKFSEIKNVKQQLYDAGALYSSMSGSGSAVFGIFKNMPKLPIPKNYSFYLQEPELQP